MREEENMCQEPLVGHLIDIVARLNDKFDDASAEAPCGGIAATRPFEFSYYGAESYGIRFFGTPLWDVEENGPEEDESPASPEEIERFLLADASKFLIHLGGIGHILAADPVKTRADYLLALDRLDTIEDLGATSEAVALLAELIDKKRAEPAGETKE
jgi:hypothetical protein